MPARAFLLFHLLDRHGDRDDRAGSEVSMPARAFLLFHLPGRDCTLRVLDNPVSMPARAFFVSPLRPRERCAPASGSRRLNAREGILRFSIPGRWNASSSHPTCLNAREGILRFSIRIIVQRPCWGTCVPVSMPARAFLFLRHGGRAG